MGLSKLFLRKIPHKQEVVDKPLEIPSLDISFELTRGRIITQFQEVDSLDVKANFIKGAATGLVGTALILQAALIEAHTKFSTYCSSLVPKFLYALPVLLQRALPLLPLLVSYIIVVIASHRAYEIDDYELIPNPEELLKNYLEEPEIITKMDLFKEMVYDYKDNERKINCKARWVRRALLWLDIEGVALVILLFIQAIC